MSDTVEVIILAKDQASKTIGGVRQSLGGLGSVVGTVGKIGMGAFLGVGAAAVGGFGLAMGAAIDMNASLEQSTMQFTTLMGDADLAAEHVANLFEFGAKTPFETGPIITASKHFQVFGGAALNTMENLTLFGDAAAAVGAPIDEVAFWVGRAYSAIQGGQPFGEAAMRLQELGLMTPEVRQKMEEMQKAGADVSDVWGVMTEDFGKFEGAMDMQSQSWTGLMSTLKDSLSMAAAEGLKPFFDLLKGGLDWLVNSGVIENVGNTVSNFIKLIMTAPDEGGPLMDYLQELPTWLQPIGVFFAEAAIVISSFFANLQEGMSPLNAFIEAIWDIAPQPVLDALIKFRDDILPGLITTFHNVADPIVAAVRNFVSFKDVLIALGIGIAAIVIPAIISIVTTLAPILLIVGAVIGVVALLRNAWENNWGGIQEKTAAVFEFLKTTISGALESIQQWWAANGERIVTQATADLEALKNAISTALAAIQQWWAANGARIIAQATADLTALRNAFSTALNTIATTIQTFINNVKAWWAEHGAGIVETARKAWDLVKGIFEGVTKQLNLIGDAFRAAFQGDWEEFGNKLFEIWENAWNTVIDFLRGLWDLIVPLFVSLWNSISGWFKSVDWASLGRNIVQGIINGVRAMGDALTGVLQGIVEAAIARIKQILGIASPSLLFEEIGVNIAQGLIEGIRSKQGEVFQTIEELVGTAGDLLGLASGFGGLFEQANIAPLEGGIAAIGEQIDAYTDSLQGMADTLGLTLNDPGIFLSLQQILNNPAATLAEKDTAAVMLAFLNERQQLTLEQIELERQLEEQQMALLRLEMQRQQLGFLQEQFNLLKLINENGLDPSILQGLTFGLDADPGAILEAMLGAMQSLVTVTAGELAAITPRTADRSIAGEFFGGVNRGGGVTVNIDARGAMNGVEREIRRVVEDVMREYGVRADIRMRT